MLYLHYSCSKLLPASYYIASLILGPAIARLHILQNTHFVVRSDYLYSQSTERNHIS